MEYIWNGKLDFRFAVGLIVAIGVAVGMIVAAWVGMGVEVGSIVANGVGVGFTCVVHPNSSKPMIAKTKRIFFIQTTLQLVRDWLNINLSV
jgi:hypothetical protein